MTNIQAPMTNEITMSQYPITMKFSLNDIVNATGGHLFSGDGGTVCEGVNIDTRSIEEGQLFVAIRGAHFDGHDFLGDAVVGGAKALLVRQGTNPPQGVAAVVVDDTEKALGDMAAWWRRKFSIPCVAITGSNGKSTTKEMAAAIASLRGPVLKTEGNFNNLIGMPLTIFRWSDKENTAILEMGMNAVGEIKRLAEIARPDIGLVTNVTAAHLEKLHTVEAVARAKGELFEAMDKDATAIVNGEDRLVKEVSGLHRGRKIVFGMQNGFDVQFLHMEMSNLDSMDLKIAVLGREYRILLPVPGAHNVMNAMAALAVGVALQVDTEASVEKLKTFRPMAMRMERIQLINGVRIVNDSYNANPGSMKAAFRTVGSAKRAGRFIAAIGDMLELGTASGKLHEETGLAAALMGVELLYVLGDHAAEVKEGALRGGLASSSVCVCDGGQEQMARLLSEELRAGDVVLIKGSRGMKMEKVVEYLKNEIGTG